VERQLSLFQMVATEKEDIRDVIKDLSRTCQDCRLGVVYHPTNRGLIWRGNPDAKIAIIGEAPGDTETEKGLPLVGASGQLWEKWASYIGLDTKKDCLLTNIVQCQPDKVRDTSTGRLAQRAPDDQEKKACFGPRCLRILRAMPNLEVVLTLGWQAAGSILGGEPISKTHENRWFRTSILPGVAVFCMVHPAFVLREPSPEKQGKVRTGLDYFKREYLLLKKVHPILKKMEEEADGDTFVL
jgi:uracil-DNA glycosylase family 4